MTNLKAPKFLGKVCIVTGGSFSGNVCMPTEMEYNGTYCYSCLEIDVDDKTIDIEGVFAWVDEEDLELHSSIKDLDDFQFFTDEDEEE